MNCGERYGWVLNLINETLEQLNWQATDIGLMYDIACKFEGFLGRYDPNLAAKTTLKVNAFHVHGHPMACQVLNGPRRAAGFGLTDGEGEERDWASKAHLAALGRNSGAQRCRQILDRQTQHYVDGKLRDMPKSLLGLWSRARDSMERAEATLRGLMEVPLSFTDMRGQRQQVSNRRAMKRNSEVWTTDC